ncbi:glycoside hydrolase family 2 TIM barrel-domain containing protein [Rubricoccus marinus]|uniref:Beta-galactosidase n=1 Tax=Rubricoccus marinus TaxID=716817 RepID=A0A259U165_9BACT|nr:glycoside hydrolase family 2 TIM barrel-domain containing protein [Rubricoccus marinus]OZC03564.1 beta-galactosidase [Rubricoccus marinus]
MLFRSCCALLGLFALAACNPSAPEASGETAVAATEGPAKVEVRGDSTGYGLFVDGEPFYIKGAGLEFGDVEALAAHGANSFRTWRTDNGEATGKEVLDRAHAAGLMVTMGLEIAREREGQGRGVFGFDYDDEEAVAAQLERVRAEVMELKDHPALLMWGIGNELNLGADNPAVWDAVNGISEMIHEVDPNHPTTTMLAGIGPELVEDIRERAPSLDLLSIQMYADIENLPQRIADAGWDGPLVITEWGATGHWEVPTTPWGAPIENNSSVKADLYGSRYRTAILSNREQILGSYVFLWGQKQERTDTWYGMFLASGEETESIGTMEELWTEKVPANRAPRLDAVTLDGRGALDAIQLDPGQTVPAAVSSSDPDGDGLRYRWEVREEQKDLSEGGDDESVPQLIPGSIDAPEAAEVAVTAPETPGAYRLFVYVFDGQNHAAHANIPFHVGDYEPVD